MGFRDDELAGRARVETLEREVDRLRAENEALKAGAAAEASEPGPKSRLGVLAVLAVVVGGSGVAAMATKPGTVLGPVLLAGFFVLVNVAVVVWLLSRLLVVVPPNRAAVLTGRRTIGPDGKERGYRVVIGGRVVRIPLLETVDELPLGPLDMEVAVASLYVRGPVPVNARLTGRVLVRRDPGRMQNAIERFLGRDEREIAEVAAQTVEGTLREVAAKRTLDEVRQADALAQAVVEAVEEDLMKLGLDLEGLEVVRVEPLESGPPDGA